MDNLVQNVIARGSNYYGQILLKMVSLEVVNAMSKLVQNAIARYS